MRVLLQLKIVNGEQKEEADTWLDKGQVWLNEKKDKSHSFL